VLDKLGMAGCDADQPSSTSFVPSIVISRASMRLRASKNSMLENGIREQYCSVEGYAKPHMHVCGNDASDLPTRISARVRQTRRRIKWKELTRSLFSSEIAIVLKHLNADAANRWLRRIAMKLLSALHRGKG
jgi:hypothetical protein